MPNVTLLTILQEDTFQILVSYIICIKNGLLQLMPVAEHFVCHHKETGKCHSCDRNQFLFLQQHNKSPYECRTDPTTSFSVHVTLDIYTIYSKV